MKKISLIMLLMIIVVPSVFASNVNVVVFYGQGCPHCAKLHTFTTSLSEKYPEFNLTEYEVYQNKSNIKIFQDFTEKYDGEMEGVPTTFINDKVLVGYSDKIGEELENEIKYCMENECLNPFEKGNNENTTKISTSSSPNVDPNNYFVKHLNIGAVITAALIDAINPCAFAVLIILLSTILIGHSRIKALKAGLAFTLSIFISYYLMGLGIYSALEATTFQSAFIYVIATIAVILGLFNLKDYLWYGKWFKMEVPESWRPKMKSVLRNITSVPGAFLIGFVISLFLLPCTSGPYLIILSLLSQTSSKNSALLFLLLYNLIFIIPMIIITLAVYFGFTTVEKAERWRTKKLKTLHLIAGLILLLLGIALFVSKYLGMI